MSFFKWSFLFSEKKHVSFPLFGGFEMVFFLLKFTWLVDPVFDDCPWQPRCLLSMSQMNPFSILAVHQRGKNLPKQDLQKWHESTNDDPEWHLSYHILLAAGTQDEHQVYQTWWMKGAEANDLLAMCTFIRILRLAVLQPKFFWVSKIYLDLNAWTVGPSFTRNWWWSSTEICI